MLEEVHLPSCGAFALTQFLWKEILPTEVQHLACGEVCVILRVKIKYSHRKQMLPVELELQCLWAIGEQTEQIE
jgi:hypothetical protein